MSKYLQNDVRYWESDNSFLTQFVIIIYLDQSKIIIKIIAVT